MTCAKCGARNQFVADVAGDVSCLMCGATPGGPVHRQQPRTRLCSKGHPLPKGEERCYVCIDRVGRTNHPGERPAIFPSKFELRVRGHRASAR